MVSASFGGATAAVRNEADPGGAAGSRPAGDAAHGRPRFVVVRTDGSPPDPAARYLVLRLDTDPFARKAAAAYADVVSATNPSLAESVRRACVSRLKHDWRLPPTPTCACGAASRPVAFEGYGQWSLEWECLECCEPVDGPAIPWPFIEAFAERGDFDRIGIGWDYL